MKYYAIIDDDGNHIESGFCPNNCDIVTALGREIKTGERYVVGKGHKDMEIAVHNTGAKKYATANHTGFCCREYYPVADRLIKRIFLTGLCSFWVKARYREAWMSTR